MDDATDRDRTGLTILGLADALQDELMKNGMIDAPVGILDAEENFVPLVRISDYWGTVVLDFSTEEPVG